MDKSFFLILAVIYLFNCALYCQIPVQVQNQMQVTPLEISESYVLTLQERAATSQKLEKFLIS